MNRKETLKNRVKEIKQSLNEKKVSFLILTNPANVCYTTGFSGDDSWVVCTPEKFYLVTDSRYTEQASKDCLFTKIIERRGPMAQTIAKLAGRKKVYIEKSATMAAFEALKKNVKSEIRSIDNTIEPLRSIKDSFEIAAIKKACQIANLAFEKARPFAKPGITENQLAGRLDFIIRNLGAINSFPTIVAFGPNGSRPHHQPTDRKLKKDDFVLIDFGVRYESYCSDLTRCFSVGKKNAFYEKVYNAVKQAQIQAIKLLKAGIEIKTVDYAARQVIKKNKLPVYGHGTGHGIGLEVHEPPFVSEKNDGKLQASMVITIEPAVYIPGKIGIRLEEDVLITNAECKILSST